MRRRVQRLNVLMRQEISDLLQREVNDPRIEVMVSLTEVRLSADLSRARVFVSIMGSPEEKKTALAGLRSATKFLRHELGDRLDMRQIPVLTFVLDDSIERGARLLSLMHDVVPAPSEEKEQG